MESQGNAWLEARVLSHMMLRKKLQNSSEDQASPDPYDVAFENIDPAYRKRARYLHSLLPIYWELGTQPAELRLSVEPFHPLRDKEVDAVVAAYLQADGVGAPDRKHGLTVLSRALVESYCPGSLVDLSGIPGGYPDLQLFDPFTGFLIWKEGNRYRNYWFGNVRGMVDLMQQPEHVRRLLIRNQADHLSLGKSLLGRVVGPLLRRPTQFTLDDAGIPTIQVNSQSELEALADDIRNACSISRVSVKAVFRGQTDEYPLPNRSDLAKAGVCPYSDIRDHSFVPSLYRKYDKFLDELANFRKLLLRTMDWNLYSDLIFGERAQYFTKDGIPYSPVEPTSPCTVTIGLAFGGNSGPNPAFEDLGPYTTYVIKDAEGRLVDEYIKRHYPGRDSVRRNLILQHYGAPTPYVDVTHDIRVAEWFALNDLAILSDGQLKSEIVKAPFRKPAIFVFLVLGDLSPIIDTQDLVEPSKSLRPHRQCCALIGGAGNLYRNAASRFVAVKIKFSDGFFPVGLPTADWLFPGPDEDNALKELLYHDRGLGHDRDLFPVYGLQTSSS